MSWLRGERVAVAPEERVLKDFRSLKDFGSLLASANPGEQLAGGDIHASKEPVTCTVMGSCT
jgi:hypothetical protein